MFSSELKPNLRKMDWFACGLLVLLSVLAKGWYLGSTPLGGDENFSVYSSQLSVPKIIDWLLQGNNPPVWEIILHYWIQVFGISEFSVRVPALIFNALTVVPLFLIGKKFFSNQMAILVGFMFSVSTMAMYFAQESRVYSLVGFLVAWSLYFYLRLLEDPKRKKALVWLTLVNALLLYSHYLSAWVLLIQGSFFLFHGPSRRSLGKVYWFHVLGVGLLVSPLFPVILQRFSDSGVGGTWVPEVTNFKPMYNMFRKFSNTPVPFYGFGLIFIAALVFRILRGKRKNPDPRIALYLAMTFIIPWSVSYALSFYNGFFLDRYFYFLLPVYYLLIGVSIHYLSRENLKLEIGLAGFTALLMVLSFKPHREGLKYSGPHVDYRPVVEKIRAYEKEDSTAVIIAPAWFDKDIVYYLDRDLYTSYFKDIEQGKVAFEQPLKARGIFMSGPDLNVTIPKKYSHVVFVDVNTQFHYPGNALYDSLENRYTKLDQAKIESVTLTEYSVRK